MLSFSRERRNKMGPRYPGRRLEDAPVPLAIIASSFQGFRVRYAWVIELRARPTRQRWRPRGQRHRGRGSGSGASLVNSCVGG